MSGARVKNQTAIERVVADKALAVRLENLRVAVISGNDSVRVSGQLLAESLGDVLGRFWPNLTAIGPLAATVIAAARSAAESGRQSLKIGESLNSPQDYVIAIGTDLPPGTRGLRIGASGWTVTAGAMALVDDDPNPVGPAAAAAVAAMEAYKVLFADALRTAPTLLPENFAWSAWTYGAPGADPAPMPLVFEDLHLIGVGAVSHGLLWMLERWPASVTGIGHLIDQDEYDDSNGQRYAGMRAVDIGTNKAVAAAQRLKTKFNGLEAIPSALDMNAYFEAHRPDCRVKLAVIGVDNGEHRRQLALKLPRRVVNMWTQDNWLGAARFGFEGGWPCPFCAYTETVRENRDETGELAFQTGLKPGRVRELLHSGAGLLPVDVAVLAQRYQIGDHVAWVGKPLRSVRGALCATGRINLPEAGVDADVPFAFSSLLAGIGGFVELVHELQGLNESPNHWQFEVGHYLNSGNLQTRGPKPGCYLCSDPLVRQVFASKYGVFPPK